MEEIIHLKNIIWDNYTKFKIIWMLQHVALGNYLASLKFSDKKADLGHFVEEPGHSMAGKLSWVAFIQRTKKL